MRPPTVLSRVGIGVLAIAIALNNVVPVLAAPPSAPGAARMLASASPANTAHDAVGATPIRETPNVIATVGAGGTYATLKAAFDDINNGAGGLTGAIQLNIVGNTVETAPAVLNASGTGAASYTSVLIQPVGGMWQISGNIAAGSPLIDLNGADNVTIDGLNTGGNALTIANSTASAISGTSTFRFIGGATNNTLTNLTILGAGAMSVTTNGATIFFSTDAVTANGNDNNTISNNNIGPISQAALPTKAILGNGSTSTTAIGNSGILITNNNIFDFFGAAVTSSGVAINGGSNTWTITNNRFYQTAPRTWTTGANHRAIDINSAASISGAQGFTITGNIIGYASNAQTGTYALTGSTGKFVGIHFNGITLGTLSTIHNNMIAAVSLAGVTSSGTGTASPFMGIFVNNGLANTNNNTLGSQALLNSLVFATNSTTATDVHGIFNFSSDHWTATGNTLGGLTVTNTAASGTYIVYGLRANTTSSVAFTGTLNLVGGTIANSIQLNATGTASQIIGMHTVNAQANFISNTIRNLTTNIGTGTTTAASVIGIVANTTTPNHTLSQNTIYNLHNSNPTAASVVTGIQFTGGSANVVERNLIYGLTAATNSTTAEVNGIRVAGGTTLYRNNMIALGAGIANALGAAATNAATTGINGINEALGTNQFFHNSVYIGGTATAGSGSSYAFNGTQTSVTRSFRDNIFFNARTNSGATGKHYAIKINGTTPNPTGLTLNNNVYFANGAGAVFGFFNSLDVANLAAWRTATGQDSGSFEANPQYNDPTNAVPDLHLHPTNLTPAENNGVDVGVVNDFDGQTRASLTPTDIGADAGNFNSLDLTAPVISYTPLGNTSLTTNRTLVATIADVTGVPTTGSLQPRLYYRKNGGAWFSFQGTLASGTGQSGSWNFTLNVSDLGGVAPGDVIAYYVIAQDTAPTPNLASNAAGAVASDVNNVSTPPAVPFTYTIALAFSGSYNVGATEIYTSLTNSGGIFQAINAGALTGNVIINVTSNLTGETGLHALNQWSEDGAGGYTLLMRPVGAARVISGTGTNANLIKLNGADRVTIDGSLNGGTDRSLTIVNPFASTTATAFWIASASTSNGATNNTIKNCLIAGASGSTTVVGILSGSGTTLGNPAEAPNSNNTLQNNVITRFQNAVFISGGTTNLDQNWVITGNTFGSTVAADKLGFRGVLIGGAQNFTISNNTILGVVSSASSSATMSGIQVSSVLSGGAIVRNTISDIKQINTAGWGSNGIFLAATSTASNLTVANNLIFDVASQGFNGTTFEDNGYGIMIETGGGYKLYHNTVRMTTNQTATTGIPAAINIAAAVVNGGVDLRDNIFANTQSVGTRYALYSSASNAVFANINYNNYYPLTGTLGFLGAAQATIAAWRTATGQDAQSVSTDPLFVSNTDLHILPTSPMRGAGTPIAGINLDYDGQTRNALTPDIGADEFLGLVTFVYRDLENAVSPGDTLYLVGDFTNWQTNAMVMTPDVGYTTFTATVPLTPNVTYNYKYVVNTFDAYGYDLLNNPGVNWALTVTFSTNLVQDYRRISQYDYFALLSPPNASIALGNPSPPIVGELFINHLTAPAGAMPGLRAQVGFGTATDPALWTWTDIPFSLQASNNDQYSGTFTPSAVGVYSYAVRFNANWGATNPNSNWVYGGLGNMPLAPDLSNAGVITVSASADLSLTKADGADPVYVTEPVYYTLTVTNHGPNPATNVQVVDMFPASTTPMQASPACMPIGMTITCTVPALAPSASVVFTAWVTPNLPGLITNTATVSFTGGTDPNPANNLAQATTTVLSKADLAVAKRADPDPVLVNYPLTYTLYITNNGPATALNLVVTDTLPASVLFNIASAGCTHMGGNQVVCTAASLAPGNSAQFTLWVTPTVAGLITNTVTASSDVHDPVLGNNGAVISTTVAASIDMFVYKTHDPDPVYAGGPLTYTLSAGSNGLVNLGTYTFFNFSPVNIPGAGSGSPYPSTINVSGINLPVYKVTVTLENVNHTFPADMDVLLVGPGGQKTLLMSDAGADFDLADTLTFDSVGIVPLPDSTPITAGTYQPTDYAPPETFPGAPPGPNPADLSVFNGGPANGTWSLYVLDDDNSDDGGMIASGWRLTITTGAVMVTDTLPTGYTFGGVTGEGWTCDELSGVVSCYTYGDTTMLAPITITGTAPMTAGLVPNVVEVSANLPDPLWDNNIYTDNVIILNSADLVVLKTDEADPVADGEPINYTIVITNNGPTESLGGTLTDTLPVGAYFVSASGSGLCTPASGLVTCEVPYLNIGESASYGIVITSSVAGLITNTAEVTGLEFDADLSNNVDIEETTVLAAPEADLALTKQDAVDPVGLGDQVLYTLTVTNNGPAAATNVYVTDTLPLSFMLDSLNTGCTDLGGGMVSCFMASLDVGNSAVFTLAVTPQLEGVYTNTAVAAGAEPDPVPSDNTAIETTTVNPVADLSLTKSADPDPVLQNSPLTYTLNIFNNGPSTAAPVLLTDTLPAEVTFASASAGCAFGSGLVTCNLGSLPPGTGTSITIVVTPTSVGVITNTAVVNGTVFDPALGNNTASATTSVNAYGVTVAPTTAAQSANPGATVTYTLWVTNTGNLTDTFTLTYLGGVWPATGPSSVGPLATGSGASVVVTVTIPVTAASGASSITIFTATSQDNASVSASSTLTTTANQIYGVTQTPASAAQSGNPGNILTYTLWVTNTGNGPDSFNIALAGNVWPTLANPTTVGPLAAGAGANVQVQVTIPATVTAGAMSVVNATATSQGNGSVNATSALTTTANQIYGVTQTPASAAQSGNPGSILTYTLRVTNTGNGPDSFNIALAGNAWPTLANPTTVGPLAAGAGANVQVQVTIPATATAGAMSVVNVTATSQGNASVNATSALTTTANQIYGVTQTPASAAQSGNPGSILTYTLRVTNTGNGPDTFNIALAGNVWPTLANPTTVGPLAAGAGANVQVQVTIPATATAGSTSVAAATATSQGNASVNATSALTTTVNQTYGVTQTPASAAQSGNPGSILTYTLRVTNTGNGSDIFNISLAGNTWPTLANPTTVGPLAAGTGANVQVQVTIPVTATSGSTSVAAATTTSQGNGSVNATSALTTTANQIYGVTQTPASAAQNGNPGSILTYTLRVTNTGNGPDSFNIALAGNVWPTLANPTTVGPLAAGAGANVAVQVTIPATATSGSTSVVNVTATSQGNASVSTSSVLTTSASQTYGVSLSPANQAQAAYVGRTITYTLTLTNTGSGSDVFSLSVIGAVWTTTVSAPTVGPLAAGASTTFNVMVTVPLTATQGATDAPTIRAVSQGNGSVLANATVTTTAVWQRLFLPFITK